MTNRSDVATVDRRGTWGLVLVAILLVGFFLPTLLQLIDVWLLDANYSHGFFILPVSFGLAWFAIREHPLPERGEPISGGITLGLGLAFQLIAVILRYPPIEFVALMLSLRGLTVFLGGRSWANHLLFPTFFLAFLFPLDAAVTTQLAVWLQDVISTISAEVLGWLHRDADGFPRCYRRGNCIIVGGAEQLYVGQECSGVRQLMAFIAMGALVAYLGGVGLARGLLILALAIPVAIVANVVRVILMGLGLIYFGPTWLTTWMHHVPAMITYPLGILIFFGLVWLIAPAETAVAQREATPSECGRVGGPSHAAPAEGNP